MFKSPGDKVTYQRNWPIGNPNYTSYDDVGRSYQCNTRWWSQESMQDFLPWTPNTYPGSERWLEAMRRYSLPGRYHAPERMVFLADPIAMLPIVWFTFELLGSITEHGNLGRNGNWVLHVMFIVAVGLHAKNAKQGRSATSPPRPSRHRALLLGTPDATASTSGSPRDTAR